MPFEIDVICKKEEDRDLIEEIVLRLNDRFKNLEDMEMRLEIYCEEVAKEMGGIVGFYEDGRISFNFTGLDIIDREESDDDGRR